MSTVFFATIWIHGGSIHAHGVIQIINWVPSFFAGNLTLNYILTHCPNMTGANYRGTLAPRSNIFLIRPNPSHRLTVTSTIRIIIIIIWKKIFQKGLITIRTTVQWKLILSHPSWIRIYIIRSTFAILGRCIISDRSAACLVGID